jgi:hypothetical protein
VKAVISSDEDLLALDPWRGVRILWPQNFLAAEVGEEPARKTGDLVSPSQRAAAISLGATGGREGFRIKPSSATSTFALG